MATTASEVFFKIPLWIIKLIPGVKGLLEKLEGQKTVIANFSIAVLAFLEGKDWIALGDTFCNVVDFVLKLIKVPFVCDPSWLNTIAVIFIAMANLALRKATTGALSKSLK